MSSQLCCVSEAGTITLTIDLGPLELPARNLLLEHVLYLGSSPVPMSVHSETRELAATPTYLFRVSGR